ncbi:GNAT family N-acetyltransferase, partial [Bacillus sp. JJ1474]|uniref:GNAT family N-acetyltransferase n=1 Tax=Bacillus sp. JJ1474 TaxID=3122955 RepID=UPI002FFE02D3
QYSCPYNYLDGNWDEFLKRQIPKKKKRNELKAFSKKLYNLGEVSLIRINDSESWGNYKYLIDQTFYIHKIRFQEVLNTSRYSEPDYKEFYNNLIERLAKKSKIDLSILCLDNKVISFLFAFKDDNRLIDYIPGFHPSFSKISLGHVHLMELFQNLIEEQEIKIFDFSKGMGIYKQKWTDSTYNNFLFNFKLNNNLPSNINWFVNNQIINLKLLGRKKGWNNRIKHILGSIKNMIDNESNIEEIQIVEVVEDLKLDKNSFIISKFRYEGIANLNMYTQKFIIDEVLMKKEILIWKKKNNLEFIEIVDDISRKLYQCKDGNLLNE